MGTGEAARLPGITVKTLQRWEREARLVPRARTASNRRRYTESQLRPDLANQRRVLEQFAVARGLAGVEFVEEVGGRPELRTQALPGPHGRDWARRVGDARAGARGPPDALRL